MAWHQAGNKPLSEPKWLDYRPIFVIRPNELTLQPLETFSGVINISTV